MCISISLTWISSFLNLYLGSGQNGDRGSGPWLSELSRLVAGKETLDTSCRYVTVNYTRSYYRKESAAFLPRERMQNLSIKWEVYFWPNELILKLCARNMSK